MKFASSRNVVASHTIVAAALSVAVTASTARADEVPVDKVEKQPGSPKAIDREWLYVDDARVAAPWNVIASASAAFTGVGNNPDPTSAPYRAFAFNTAQPGTLLSLGGELGLVPRLSLEVLGQVDVGGMTGSASPGAVAGLRLDVGPSAWRNVHLLVSGGYLRETWSAPV
ncbi:MAG: hypothetical protein JOZ69_02765, partial [Myxococcales bacterium]|nr:hypothetical protein [Myxococcales bacterium]